MPDDVKPKIEQKLADELLEIHVQSYGKGARLRACLLP
jgi:hypothetical protein